MNMWNRKSRLCMLGYLNAALSLVDTTVLGCHDTINDGRIGQILQVQCPVLFAVAPALSPLVL